MATQPTCEECGTELPANAPQGLCPRCLVSMGLHLAPQNPAPVSVLPVERIGDRIGRYKLLQKIGEGGCGSVYMAEQEEPVRRRVALKVIKLGMDTRQVIARFEAERQALALMDHANIAKVLEAGATDTGRPYFVMELVRGIKITHYCDENNLSTEERLDLFIQVSQAVQHAHQKGIIHRDIKPSNILVADHDGVPVPKIIDFGIAKATTDQRLTDKTLFTAFEQFMGTPAYMSPEQARMSGLDIDTRTDIYSLGVLLYELLTGKTPFDAQDLLAAGLDEMRRTISEKEPARPSTRLSTMLDAELTTTAKHRRTDAPKLIHLLRGDLDWIVMKALEKDRARRYETANGLAMDIQRHLENEPVVARPPSTGYRFQKLVRRNKLAFAAAAAVTIALVLGVVVSTWQAIRATRAEHNEASLRQAAEAARATEQTLRREAQARELSSRQNSYGADINAASRALAEGNLGLARDFLAGCRPRVGEEDLRGFEWRYLWKLSRGNQIKTLLGHSNSVNCLAYSPDGTVLASGSSDHTVRLWNPHTGDLIGTCVGHSGHVNSVAFTPDGSLLASGGQDGLVRFWDARTWQIISTLTNRSPRLAFSGHLLALAAGATRWGFDGGEVKLWDYTSRREVMTLPESGNCAAFSPDGKILATANWMGLVKLWDTASGGQTRAFPSKLVRCLAFSPDGRLLAWCADEGEVRLWDLAEEQPRVLIKRGGELVFGVAFSPDGQILAVAKHYDIVLWNVPLRAEWVRLRGHAGQVAAVAFSPDGKSLASASLDGTLMLWKSSAPPRENVISNVSMIGEWRGLGCPVFSADSKLLAGKSGNGGIQVWQLPTGRATLQLKTVGLPAAFSSEGRSLLVLGDRGTSLQEWNLATQTPGRKTAYREAIDHAVLSPDRQMFAQVSDETQLVLRSAVTGRLLFALPDSAETRNVDFSPDGRLLAIAKIDGTAKMWDWSARRVVWKVEFRESDGIDGLAFSPDGKLFATTSWSGPINVYDASTRKELRTLKGHKAGTTCVAFSSDSRTLASASDDSTLRLWNLATGREMIKIDVATVVRFLIFSPDGEIFAVGEANDTVRLLHAPPTSEIEPTDPPPALIEGSSAPKQRSSPAPARSK